MATRSEQLKANAEKQALEFIAQLVAWHPGLVEDVEVKSCAERLHDPTSEGGKEMKGKDYLEQLKRAKAAKEVRLPVSGPETDPKPSGGVFPDGKPDWWSAADLPAKAPASHRGLRLVCSYGREV